MPKTAKSLSIAPAPAQVEAPAVDQMEGFRPPTRYIPIPKWPNYHPWPTPATHRWNRFHGAPYFVKVGGKVLIDERKFFEWVEREAANPSKVVGQSTGRPPKTRQAK